MAESDLSNSSLRPSSPAPKCPVCKEFNYFMVFLSEARKAAKTGCEPCAILVSAAEAIYQQEERIPSRQRPQKTPGKNPYIRVDGGSDSTLSITMSDSINRFSVFTTSKPSSFRVPLYIVVLEHS